MTENLVFVKLGGSLITNKREEAHPRRAIIHHLAETLKHALKIKPDLKVLLGHGSGSFGHWEAKRYGTRAGVHTAAQWKGFSKVSASAARLNRIVTDAFLGAHVPVVSLQPSATVIADAGRIVSMNTENLQRALDNQLIPLIYGDVAFDRSWGGTILSTEDLFVHLAATLAPQRILLLGNASGVMDDHQNIIPSITPANYPQIAPCLQGSSGTDVTGGMADKVQQMIHLVQDMPDLRVWILTGRNPDNLKRALLNLENIPGTCIQATEPAPDA